MNKFLSKFGFGSSSLATRDNSNNNSSNKKKKNSPRNIINARDAINNDVVKYIKNSLPRAQATRERKKKFGGSQHKCAIDALINERKKYVDEESS